MKIRHINMQNLISEKETLEANILTKRREVTANNKMLRVSSTPGRRWFVHICLKGTWRQNQRRSRPSRNAAVWACAQTRRIARADLNGYILRTGLAAKHWFPRFQNKSHRAVSLSYNWVFTTWNQILSYTREKHEKRIALITEQLIGCTAELERTTSRLEDLRKEISALSKEVNESGAALSRLRENIRLRKLVRQIANLNDEIASHDMEQAATARKNFDEQYNREKTRETEMQSRVCQLLCLMLPSWQGL